MQIELDDNERIEDMQCDGLKIVQNKNLYTFTSDSVILANFVKLKSKEVALEIGAGSGVISILLSKKQKFEHIDGFEIQKDMFLLANKNLKLNNLEDKISFVNDDVKNYKKYFKDGSFDVVFSNPPYKREGSAKDNLNKSRAIARHEKNLPLEVLTKVTSKLLKFGGRFYVVFDADRSCELISSLMSNNLEPKRMFFTENGKGKSILVVIEAVKGGKHGVEVLKTITTNDKDGTYINELGKTKK